MAHQSRKCRHEGKEIDDCQTSFKLAGLIREINQGVPIYIYTDKVDEKMRRKP